MEIIIKGESEKGAEKIIITNNHLDNYNYIELIINKNVITLPVSELYRALESFNNLKNDCSYYLIKGDD